MNITIEAWPGKEYWGGSIRGRKKVLVDGVHWGTFIMTTHGSNGAKYTLYAACGQEISANERGGTLHVWSEKRHSRLNNLRFGTPVTTIEDRLRDLATQAMEGDKLKHPDVLKGEQGAAAKRYQEHVKRAEAGRMRKLRARAEAFILRQGLPSVLGLKEALAKEFADVIELGL